MIDVVAQINAVSRRVGARTLPAGQSRTVIVSQTYDAPVEDVWDACTSAERISRWFTPVSGDLRLGGRYQLEGNAGGTVERCDPPKSFGVTWEYGGGTSWVEVRLYPEAGGTRFELEHLAEVGDERWAQFGPGAVGVGWDLGLLGLAQHLSRAGAGIEPAEAMAWLMSDEGRRFVTDSSTRWGEANIEAGADPADARAMAEMVTAFYTGADPGA